MKKNISAQDFLRDLIPLILEKLRVEKQNSDDFDAGKVFAYYDVLSLIQSQAKVFDVNLDRIRLNYELIDELLPVELHN